MNVYADLQKLQQLESSAFQAELVQAILVMKGRLPRKIMKRQHHFKKHWRDDYPRVEHDQHVLQGMQITLYVLHFLLLLLCLFTCNYRLP